MTTQISDKLAYRGGVYHLEVRGTRLFDPRRVGLKPIQRSTANWRWLSVHYLVDDRRLFLDRVGIGLNEPSPLYSHDPVLNELGTTWTYSNLHHPFKFTGYLRIGDDRYRKNHSQVRIYREPPEETVLRLEFERGQLIRVTDESSGLRSTGSRSDRFNATAHTERRRGHGGIVRGISSDHARRGPQG